MDEKTPANVDTESTSTFPFSRLAAEMNLVAVKRMIDLCTTFKQLESYVHVSTAYANCDRDVIDEVVYPAIVDPVKILEAFGCVLQYFI